MEIKELVSSHLKAAMKSGDQDRLTALKLILTALKDKEIALRSVQNPDARLSVLGAYAVLETMIKQRQQSIDLYKQGNRQDLVDKEEQEVAVIKEFLPSKLSEDELRVAVTKAVAETKASSAQDMRIVLEYLKNSYPGQIDSAVASQIVKKALS